MARSKRTGFDPIRSSVFAATIVSFEREAARISRGLLFHQPGSATRRQGLN